jgi:drug/metabolite transporter (DMT)-like permease
VNSRKYLVLAAILIFGPLGDVFLKRGMQQVGAVTAAHWTQVISAVFTPWVAVGICFLLVFFAAYLHALSWADLTYVLPATSLGYVLLALLSTYLLHEEVNLTRWLGILLVSAAVGFVTRGPEVTPRKHQEPRPEPALAATMRSEP